MQEFAKRGVVGMTEVRQRTIAALNKQYGSTRSSLPTQPTPPKSAEVSFDETEALHHRRNRLETENAQLNRQPQLLSSSSAQPHSARKSGNRERTLLLATGILIVAVIVTNVIFKTAPAPSDGAAPLNQPKQPEPTSRLPQHDKKRPPVDKEVPSPVGKSKSAKAISTVQAVQQHSTETPDVSQNEPVRSGLPAPTQKQSQTAGNSEHTERRQEEVADMRLVRPSEPTEYAKADYAKAEAAYEAGEYARAMQLYSAALEGGYNRELALANRAVARLKLGDTKNAIKDLESAIEFGSVNGDVYFTMGYALYLEGKFDRALTYLGTAIKLQPDDDRSYRYRDAIHRAKRKPRG
jgi:tetratricopeptide (TPR) repeat protein